MHDLSLDNLNPLSRGVIQSLHRISQPGARFSACSGQILQRI